MPKNPFSAVQKKFSVIVPVYGDSYRTFPQFFGALNEQDYKEFEVIVVFDGENKKAEKELAKEVKNYPGLSITFLTIEHGGAPAARNAGAEVATGDYYTFLDPDVYPLSESFRKWANAFEEYPEKDVVWGLYGFINGDKAYTIPDAVPKDPKGNPDYWAFRFSNFCSGMFPMRREAFVGWDETVKSLQDWDMWQRMLLKDDFKGERFLYIPESFAITEMVREGGISQDSHQNWIERTTYIRNKNGIPKSKICVTSIGAPWHGLHVARKLGADYLPMPSFKEHEYEAIYLLGFYPGAGGPTKTHLAVFGEPGQVGSDEKGLPEVVKYFGGRKIIHWIGTDVLKMRTEVPFVTIKYFKDLWREHGFELLTEAQHTHDELEELGIETKIVPIPPDTLFVPSRLPLNFTVAVYENPTQNLYYNDLMEQVARSLPDIQFYFFGDETKKGRKEKNIEHLGWIDLKEWMPKFSCNLRVTIHDGLPLTPLQFLTAGRYVISTTPLRGAAEVKPDRKEIVEAIRTAQSSKTPEVGISEYWHKELDFNKFKTTLEDLCKLRK
jgi:glycosyltransferase involved in cell wall biosynthesis